MVYVYIPLCDERYSSEDVDKNLNRAEKYSYCTVLHFKVLWVFM